MEKISARLRTFFKHISGCHTHHAKSGWGFVKSLAEQCDEANRCTVDEHTIENIASTLESNLESGVYVDAYNAVIEILEDDRIANFGATYGEMDLESASDGYATLAKHACT